MEFGFGNSFVIPFVVARRNSCCYLRSHLPLADKTILRRVVRSRLGNCWSCDWLFCYRDKHYCCYSANDCLYNRTVDELSTLATRGWQEGRCLLRRRQQDKQRRPCAGSTAARDTHNARYSDTPSAAGPPPGSITGPATDFFRGIAVFRTRHSGGINQLNQANSQQERFSHKRQAD